MEFERDWDVPDKPYYLEPEVMGLNVPLWVPADMPMDREDTLCVIVDTSGSVSDRLLKEFLAEIKGLAESDGKINFVFMSADTVVRGEPKFYSADDIEMSDGAFEVGGRGGTCIRDSIINAVNSEWGRSRAFSKIVYFTDLGDYPPMRSQLPEFMPPVIFVAPETCISSDWVSNTSEYAVTVAMTESASIDLDDIEDSLSGDEWRGSLAM